MINKFDIKKSNRLNSFWLGIGLGLPINFILLFPLFFILVISTADNWALKILIVLIISILATLINIGVIIYLFWLKRPKTAIGMLIIIGVFLIGGWILPWILY